MVIFNFFLFSRINPNFGKLAMIQVIIGAVASTYEMAHPKFHNLYLRDRPDLQREQAENFLCRQNIENPCANKNIINLK